MICLFLYYQFHAEASLGGLLHDLTALRGERGAVGVAQWRGGHFLHHEVERGDGRLFAVGDADGDGAILGHRAFEHLVRQPLCLL